MEIKGFYHVCLVNEWQSIVTDQIKKIMNSELYSKSNEIYIGCCGNGRDGNGKAALQSMIQRMPKFKILYHNNSIYSYEIPTLKHLQTVCNQPCVPTWNPVKASPGDFLVWYIHSKGVTSGQCKWREEMDEAIINQNELCIKLLETDTSVGCCGLRITHGGFPFQFYEGWHFSGNFWWARASYINSIKEDLTTVMNVFNNRFVAEAFIGMTDNAPAAMANIKDYEGCKWSGKAYEARIRRYTTLSKLRQKDI